MKEAMEAATQPQEEEEEWLREFPTKDEVQGWRAARMEEQRREAEARRVAELAELNARQEVHVAEMKEYARQAMKKAKSTKSGFLFLDLTAAWDGEVRHEIVSKICARLDCHGRAWTSDDGADQKYISAKALGNPSDWTWKLKQYQIEW